MITSRLNLWILPLNQKKSNFENCKKKSLHLRSLSQTFFCLKIFRTNSLNHLLKFFAVQPSTEYQEEEERRSIIDL